VRILVGHDAGVEPEEQEPFRLVGWHVVEAGRRQAWPFINLADPESGREVRVFIDATFAVEPGWPSIRQHDQAAVLALDALSGLTVTEVEATGGCLRLLLGGSSLTVQGEGNDLTSHSPWWVGKRPTQ
jgi:hypothetical protein